VRVNVTSPSPFTLSVLASYDAGIYDSALYLAHATAQDPWAQSWGSTHSASYGAYWVAAFVPRREIVLEANPGSWRHPYYTTVIIRENTSSAARVAAVLAGTATHTSGLDWSDFESAVDAARADGATATILQTGPAVVGWHLNTASGPLANPQVRQAISLGINRVELANSLDQGYAQPSVLTVPPTFGQAQPTAFDPQQARSLLRAAGYPDGITVSLYTNDGEADDNASAVLKFVYDQMVEIGVVINTTYIQDTDQLLSLARSPGLESTMLTETPLLGGAGFLLEQNANAALDPLSDASEQHYASAALQSSLNQLASSSGGASTQALIGQAASAIDAKTPTINLYAIPVQNVTRAGVTGYAAYTEPVTYYENLRPGG